jgi:hypothetical protein
LGKHIISYLGGNFHRFIDISTFFHIFFTSCLPVLFNGAAMPDAAAFNCFHQDRQPLSGAFSSDAHGLAAGDIIHMTDLSPRLLHGMSTHPSSSGARTSAV